MKFSYFLEFSATEAMKNNNSFSLNSLFPCIDRCFINTAPLIFVTYLRTINAVLAHNHKTWKYNFHSLDEGTCFFLLPQYSLDENEIKCDVLLCSEQLAQTTVYV
jgi:hypothetical protein